MSNESEQFLSPEQKIKQKELMSKLKKEVDDIENKVKEFENLNAEMERKRKLKIRAEFYKRLLPYIVCGGLVIGGISSFFGIPFYFNKATKYSNIMTEFDKNGNVRQEQQYEWFENDDNKIIYCSKWVKIADEQYLRTVKTYIAKEKTKEEIRELISQKNIKLKDVLGDPVSTIKETKNYITAEELKEGPYLKAIVYDVNKEDYIIIKKTFKENVLITVLGVCIFLETLFLVDATVGFSNKNHKKTIDKINEEYVPIEYGEFSKTLEIKKSNYERLTR